MSAAEPLAIAGAAALTAAGSIAQTCGAVRANLVRFCEHTFFETAGKDPEWDEETPLVAAPVREVDPAMDGPERLVAMLAPVLGDLLREAEMRRAEIRETALLVALPALDPVVESWSLESSFFDALSARTGLVPKLGRTTQVGHAGLFQMFAEAASLLAEGRAGTCIVAGVDSHLAADRLAHLDRTWRIKSPRNVDGFVPGEAAVAFVVERAAPGQKRTLLSAGRVPRRPLGRIAALGFGQEPRTCSGDKPSSGAGLSAAIRAATGPRSPAWALCDLNGESYRAFEWGAVRSRLGERLSGLTHVAHPASSLGDTGAASGGILIAAALAGFSRGYAPAPEALLWTSSDGPARAAAWISLP